MSDKSNNNESRRNFGFPRTYTKEINEDILVNIAKEHNGVFETNTGNEKSYVSVLPVNNASIVCVSNYKHVPNGIIEDINKNTYLTVKYEKLKNNYI